MFTRLKTAPWARVLRGLVWFWAGFVMLAGVPSAGIAYTDFPSFARGVGIFALVGGMLALQLLVMFTAIWALHDVPAEWAATKKFFRDLPDNWRRLWLGTRRVLRFLRRLPRRCWRGFTAACRWVASLPGAWRALDGSDKKAVVTTFGVFSVLGVTCYFMWPVATFLSKMAPFWVLSRDTFVYKFITSLFLSCFAWVFVLLFVRGVIEFVDEAIYRIRSRFRRK